jgi:hypothetical protein
MASTLGCLLQLSMQIRRVSSSRDFCAFQFPCGKSAIQVMALMGSLFPFVTAKLIYLIGKLNRQNVALTIRMTGMSLFLR